MRDQTATPLQSARPRFIRMPMALVALGAVGGLAVSGWAFSILPGVYRHLTYQVAEGQITGIVDGCLYRVKVTGIRSTYLDATGLIPCAEAERKAAEKHDKAVTQVIRVRAVAADYPLPDGSKVSAIIPVRLAGGYDLVVGGRITLQYHPDEPGHAERRMANPLALSWQGQYGIEAPPPDTVAPRMQSPAPKVEPGTTRYYVFATFTAVLFAICVFGPIYILSRTVKWLRGRNRTPPPPLSRRDGPARSQQLPTARTSGGFGRR